MRALQRLGRLSGAFRGVFGLLWAHLLGGFGRAVFGQLWVHYLGGFGRALWARSGHLGAFQRL